MHASITINIKILKTVYRYFYNIIFYRITLATDYFKEIKIYINTVYINYKDSKFTKNYIIFYIENLII